jgi:DNA mismatch repair protein MutS
MDALLSAIGPLPGAPLPNQPGVEEVDLEAKPDHELNVTDRMTLINKSLDEQILYESMFTLMNVNKHTVTAEEENRATLNDYVYQDIEMLADHYGNEEKSIFQMIDKTQTHSGKIMLKEMLLAPITDISLLEKRQKLIKEIGVHKKALLPHIEKIRATEKEMLWFYQEKNMHHLEMMNDLIYFNYDFIPFLDVNEILNGNEKALLFTNIYKIFLSPALTIITPIVNFIIPIVLFFWFQRKTGIKLQWSMIWKVLMNIMFGSDSFNMLFKNPSRALLANILTKGLYVFLYFQNVYYSIQNAKNTNKIINMIHEKLNHLTGYVRNVHEIISYCHRYGVRNHYDASIDLSLDRCKKYIEIYQHLFKHSIFETEPSLFSNKGKILYTYRHFNKIKDDFIHLFHYVGMIDAFAALNNLVYAHDPTTNPYTFTKYIKDTESKTDTETTCDQSARPEEEPRLTKEPTIRFEDIWHPYLIKDTRLNSLDIDKKHILITGPNAAGKSTFIKSVIVNLILSQTVGIAAASHFEMTPFHLIETYLQIPDAKGVSSLFEAEMLRSKHYIDKLKKMPQARLSFIVLDEIFSSTNYMEGFSGAYAILKKIASFPNAMSMTTTHYSDLEYLEKATHGKILNYHFEIDRNPQTNEIIFNYRLKTGVSRNYIALELLKDNGFDEDLIDCAMEMCKRIQIHLADPVNEEVSSEPVNEEVSSDPVNEEVSSDPVNEEVSSDPVNEEVSSEPVNEEVSSEPVNEEVSSEPEIKEEKREVKKRGRKSKKSKE